MALPATEDFVGSAGNLANPPWENHNSPAVLARNGSGAGGSSAPGNDCDAMWVSDTFQADHYSQFTIAGAGFKFPTVRNSGDIGAAVYDLYAFVTDGTTTNSYISKRVNSVETVLVNCAVATSVSDLVKLEVIGSVLTAYKNSVSIGSVSDATFTTGAPGLGTDSAGAFDNWEGGDVAADIQTPTRNRKLATQQRMVA